MENVYYELQIFLLQLIPSTWEMTNGYTLPNLKSLNTTVTVFHMAVSILKAILI